jgi:hypothetical protein
MTGLEEDRVGSEPGTHQAVLKLQAGIPAREGGKQDDVSLLWFQNVLPLQAASQGLLPFLRAGRKPFSDQEVPEVERQCQSSLLTHQPVGNYF